MAISTHTQQFELLAGQTRCIPLRVQMRGTITKFTIQHIGGAGSFTYRVVDRGDLCPETEAMSESTNPDDDLDADRDAAAAVSKGTVEMHEVIPQATINDGLDQLFQCSYQYENQDEQRNPRVDRLYLIITNNDGNPHEYGVAITTEGPTSF